MVATNEIILETEAAGKSARRSGTSAASAAEVYPGAPWMVDPVVSSCRRGENQFLFVDRCSLFVKRSANWEAIETRTNGTANGNVTSQTVWSAAYINAAVLQDAYSGGVIQPNSRIYFQQDANWDTTAIVGYNGTTGTWGVTQRYVYSPYGTITVLNADWSTPASGTQPLVNNLYQGMTLDSVTGLYYERNRNYSPLLGTWTSQDPLQYINGANTYQFVMSNPVGNVDPWGTACKDSQQNPKPTPTPTPNTRSRGPQPTYKNPWSPDTSGGGNSPNPYPYPYPSPGSQITKLPSQSQGNSTFPVYYKGTVTGTKNFNHTNTNGTVGFNVQFGPGTIGGYGNVNSDRGSFTNYMFTYMITWK